MNEALDKVEGALDATADAAKQLAADVDNALVTDNDVPDEVTEAIHSAMTTVHQTATDAYQRADTLAKQVIAQASLDTDDDDNTAADTNPLAQLPISEAAVVDKFDAVVADAEQEFNAAVAEAGKTADAVKQAVADETNAVQKTIDEAANKTTETLDAEAERVNKEMTAAMAGTQAAFDQLAKEADIGVDLSVADSTSDGVDKAVGNAVATGGGGSFAKEFIEEEPAKPAAAAAATKVSKAAVPAVRFAKPEDASNSGGGGGKGHFPSPGELFKEFKIPKLFIVSVFSILVLKAFTGKSS